MKRDSRPKNEGRVHLSDKETRFRYEHMLRRSCIVLSFPWGLPWRALPLVLRPSPCAICVSIFLVHAYYAWIAFMRKLSERFVTFGAIPMNIQHWCETTNLMTTSVVLRLVLTHCPRFFRHGRRGCEAQGPFDRYTTDCAVGRRARLRERIRTDTSCVRREQLWSFRYRLYQSMNNFKQ